ncbi:MAG: amino acid adenylation domain-containing protein [Deltaproteobacteria bacterium]|nr:amino acid adenylation domain-containing protein [Deltaproteobacteria bacterium]
MNDLLSADTLKNQQAMYWRNRGVDASACVSLIQRLSVDRPRSGSTRCAIELELSDDATDNLRRISGGSDVALFILLVTAFKAVVARFTGESLVAVLSPVYRKAETNGACGRSDYVLFQDRVNLAGGLKENAFVTQRTVIGAYSNQDSFAVEVGKRSLIDEHALLMFDSLHDAAVAERSPLAIRVGWRGRKLVGSVVFDPDLVQRRVVVELADHLTNVIEQSSCATSKRFCEMEWLSDETGRLGQGPIRPIESCALHELFTKQARQTPSATALICGERSVSYAELDELSTCLARGLVARGAVAGDFVALPCTRSVEMVAAILAAGKAGAAFVPISPETPDMRLAAILAATGPRCVLTDLERRIPGETPVLSMAEVLASADDAILPSVAPEAAAYAIFTSGSTGVPKGVVIEHRGIVNAVTWRITAYGLSPAHRALLVLAPNFDGFTLNLFSALAAGATTVLVRDDDVRSASALVETLRAHAITQMAVTPALFHAMLSEATGSDLSSLASVTLAGDVTRPATIALCRSLRADLRLCNEYGPTENSVVSTFEPNMEVDTAGVIGKPIDNVAVHILDEELRPVPLGVYGQIALAGPGLARGYLNDADETAKRFLSRRGQRIYLTGDIGRWRPDHTIEFRGRVDDQVKVRGFRIEIEDIRRQLLSHDGVKEAVVFVDDATGDPAIIACFTESSAVDPDALFDHLRARLPGYMVPAEVVKLDQIPLTEVGKYDLVEVRARVGAERVKTDELAATDVEQRLAAIWSRILGVEQIGVNKSFFALGGHSLKATRLLTRIHAEFGVVLALEEIFRSNTIRQLAAIIERDWANPSATIKLVGERPTYPVSSAQQRMLVLAADETLQRSYGVPIVLEIAGEVDVDRLEHAVNAVVQRHDGLRTYFLWEGNRPMQAIGHGKVVIRRHTITAADDVGEAIRGLSTRFDLASAPLLAVTLVDAGDRKYLLIELHHVIVDEASLAIFLSEVQQVYGGAELPPAPSTRYVDYAVWQRERQASPAYLEKLAYWKDKLAGAQLGPIALPLEVDDDAEPGAGGQHVLRLDEGLTRSIRDLCRAQELTQFMFFVGAFAAHLHRLTGQDEIVIGSPISERFRPETRGVIGLFLNTLLLHHRIDASMTAASFLQTVKKQLLLDVANSEVQLEDVLGSLAVKRSLDNRAAFNVVVAAVEEGVGTLQLGDAELRAIDVHNGTAKFDLLLEVRASDDDLRLVFEYARGRLRRSTVEALAEGLVAVLRIIVAAPETLLASLPPQVPWRTDTPPADAASSPEPTDWPTPVRSSLEADLIDTWATVLGIARDRVARTDSFFMLGGDSLGIMLVAKAVRTWGYSVKLGELFEHDTIEKLCTLLRKQAS